MIPKKWIDIICGSTGSVVTKIKCLAIIYGMYSISDDCTLNLRVSNAEFWFWYIRVKSRKYTRLPK